MTLTQWFSATTYGWFDSVADYPIVYTMSAYGAYPNQISLLKPRSAATAVSSILPMGSKFGNYTTTCIVTAADIYESSMSVVVTGTCFH